MPMWVIKQEGEPFYWMQTGDQLFKSGEWVRDIKTASRFGEDVRIKYASEHPDGLPAGFVWHCVTHRYKDALDIQSAVNPSGIARALAFAYSEVIAEGGDTRAQQEDPACHLILYQLMWLSGLSDGYRLESYQKDSEACKQMVNVIETAKKGQ